jgi:hypothetical protein
VLLDRRHEPADLSRRRSDRGDDELGVESLVRDDAAASAAAWTERAPRPSPPLPPRATPWPPLKDRTLARATCCARAGA